MIHPTQADPTPNTLSVEPAIGASADTQDAIYVGEPNKGLPAPNEDAGPSWGAMWDASMYLFKPDWIPQAEGTVGPYAITDPDTGKQIPNIYKDKYTPMDVPLTEDEAINFNYVKEAESRGIDDPVTLKGLKHAGNLEQFDFLLAESNKHVEQWKTYGAGSGWQQSLTAIAASLVDPVQIPFMAITTPPKIAQMGVLAGRIPFQLGMGLTGIAVSEAIVQGQQGSRGYEEMYSNVVLAGQMALGLGAASAAIGVATGRIVTSFGPRLVNETLRLRFGDNAIPAVGSETTNLRQLGDSVNQDVKAVPLIDAAGGAARVDDVQMNRPGLIEELGEELQAGNITAQQYSDIIRQERLKYLGLRNPKIMKVLGYLSPQVRVASSQSTQARLVIDQLADDLFERGKHRYGVTVGESAENLISKRKYGYLTRYHELADEGFVEVKRAGVKMSNSEYKVALGRALVQGDHEVEAVKAAASKMRGEIFDQIEQESLETGLIGEKQWFVKDGNQQLREKEVWHQPDAPEGTVTTYSRLDPESGQRVVVDEVNVYKSGKQNRYYSDVTVDGKTKKIPIKRSEEPHAAPARERVKEYRAYIPEDQIPRRVITKGARKGEFHPISATERYTVIDPAQVEQRGVATVPVGDKFYYPRIWNYKYLLDNQHGFADILEANERKRFAKRFVDDEEGASVEQLQSLEDDIDYLRDSVYEFTREVGRSKTGAVGSTGGAKGSRLHDRTFNIDTKDIQDFLVQDADHAISSYINSIIPRIELTKKFGNFDMRDQLDAIHQEYADLAKAVPDGSGAQAAINKEAQRTMSDVHGMREVLLGDFDAAVDPKFNQLGKNLRAYNYVTRLGGVLLSSIADIGSVVVQGGMMSLGREMVSLATHWKSTGLKRQQARIATAAMDRAQNRHGTMWMGDLDQTHKNKVDDAFNYLSQKMGKLTGLNAWNDFWKTTAVNMFNHEVGKLITKGGLSPDNITWLAKYGIDDEALKTMKSQWAKHGVMEDGLRIPNTEQWDNTVAVQDARNKFEGAMLRNANHSVVTPGIGDQPLWTRTVLGKVMTQFMSFTMASNNRLLMNVIQDPTVSKMSGVAVSILMADVATGLKDYALGREPETNPVNRIASAMDRSGVFGIPSEINNKVSDLVGANIGGFFGADDPTYRGRGLGTLFGPTYGTGESVVQALKALEDDVSQGEINAIKRLVPYNNLFYLDAFFRSLTGDNR